MIGAEMVAKAPPDGYTVLMASVAEVAINQSLYARMTYDPLKDLAPVTLAGFTPLILVVHPSVQARSVKELIDRKSTRLNSSHRCISYAVFCLKKKKQTD